MCVTFKETIKPTPPSSIDQFLFTQILTCTLQYYLQTFKLWFKHSHKPFEIQLKHLITRSKHKNSRLKLSVKQVKHFIINIKPLQWHLNGNLKLAFLIQPSRPLTKLSSWYSNILITLSCRTLIIRFKHSIPIFNVNIQLEHSKQTCKSNIYSELTFSSNIHCKHSMQTWNSAIFSSNHHSKLPVSFAFGVLRTCGINYSAIFTALQR